MGEQTPSGAIATFDLTPVTERLRRAGVPDPERLEAEFRKLATLWSFYPGVPLAPSKRLDRYWHELILDTRRYARFCAEAVGRQVPHVPGDGTSMEPEWSHTVRLYEQHFGAPDRNVWAGAGPDSMSCRSD